MAKALLGYRILRDDRLVREAARLRTRVRDLEKVIQALEVDNDRLRADLALRTGSTAGDASAGGADTPDALAPSGAEVAAATVPPGGAVAAAPLA